MWNTVVFRILDTQLRFIIFLYCRKDVYKRQVDFVTRHHYTIDPPEYIGHYAYSELMKAEDGFANLKTTRDIIDSFPEYKGLQIHICLLYTSFPLFLPL